MTLSIKEIVFLELIPFNPPNQITRLSQICGCLTVQIMYYEFLLTTLKFILKKRNCYT